MRLRPLFLFACSFGLLSSSVVVPRATAQIPFPPNCTIDRVVVGNSSGTAIGVVPAGYDVSVRDINNNPIPNVSVVLDFSAASIRLYAVQNAGTTVDCALRTIKQVTNVAGRVRFAPRIGRFDNANAIEIRADGVLLGRVPGRSTDIDGLGGQASLSDFVLFTARYNTPAQETDFDEGGNTGLGDFLLFASEYNGPVQPYCP